MSQIVTAGIILIGDELLSGRTQDTNLSTIATFLAPLGVQVGEGRIIADDRDVIISTIREFSSRFNYVFTTGGIGPTHDDITAECVASAFDRNITIRDDAVEILLTRYDKADLNEARLRMARIPDGASLIANPVSQAPGFQTENVFTLAGVPRIMRAMLEDVPHRIKGGAKTYSVTIDAIGIGEGTLAEGLGEIAEQFPTLSLGSYPYYSGAKKLGEKHGSALVARGTDEALLKRAEKALKTLVDQLSNG